MVKTVKRYKFRGKPWKISKERRMTVRYSGTWLFLLMLCLLSSDVFGGDPVPFDALAKTFVSSTLPLMQQFLS